MALSQIGKCKVTFDFCIKSLSMVFNSQVQSPDVDKFPIVIVLSKGEHRVETPAAKLLPGKSPNQFSAAWEDARLQVVVSMESIGDRVFSSKKIKLSINVSSEEGPSSKSKALATVNFDLATLRLAFVAKTTKEKKLLCLKPVRRASETISSVEMLLDIRHTAQLETFGPLTVRNSKSDPRDDLSPLSSPEPLGSPPKEFCPPKPRRSGQTQTHTHTHTETPVPKVEPSSAKESTLTGKAHHPNNSPGEVVKGRQKRTGSLANLLKPTQNASNALSSSNPNKTGAQGIEYHRFHDLLGIARVRIRGLTLPEDDACLPAESNSLVGSESPSVDSGVYCVMSVTGGNTRSKSSVVPIYPNRPVIFSDAEREHMFYTNQSRQLFILCRKVELDGVANIPSSPSPSFSPAISDDNPCIGAANLPLTNCSSGKLSEIGTIEEMPRESEVLLSLQPKGSIQLGICFTPLLPRCRVSCEGVITVLCASNLNVPGLTNFDVSCTVKLDKDVLDTTSPAPSSEISTEGWRTEGISFVADKSLDLDLQLWAYGEDGTTTWCGICILPVSFIVPLRQAVEDKQVQNMSNGDPLLNLKKPYKERLLLDLEPQGQIEVYLSLMPVTKATTKPTAVSSGGATSTAESTPSPSLVGQAQVEPSVSSSTTPAPSATHYNAKSLKRTATLRRRKKQNIMQPDSPQTDPRPASPKSAELTLPQLPPPEPLPDSSTSRLADSDLQLENMDLKREIEYLREELKRLKSTLSEMQFYREKAEAELQAISPKKPKKKSSGLFGITFKKDKEPKSGKKAK